MNDSRQFLMISYAFPPVGGAGVQRSVKFVKYIRKYGWQPTVLTVLNPSVPVLDQDLSRDVPADVSVFHARTLEPSYSFKRNLIHTPNATPSRLKTLLRGWASRWLQPDAQVLWNRNAYGTACKVLKQRTFSAIYVSGPPFSSFLLGCQLKKQFGIPLVLDFRDEWSISARYLENRSQQRSSHRGQTQMFESTLRQADAIVATTLASADELTSCCKRVGSSAFVRCIYNGFDPDDLLHLKNEPIKTKAFRLVYTGTLWKLTDIEPLVRAVQKLSMRSPHDANKLELHFVGRRTGEQEAILDKLASTPVQLHRHDYLSHQQSLQFACEADGLLLTLADQPGAERVVPGKLFEYLALKRPILSLVPEGEAWRLLAEEPLATNIHPSQIDAIEAWLRQAIHAKANSDSPVMPLPNPDLSSLNWCSRSTLAGALAAILERVANHNPP